MKQYKRRSILGLLGVFILLLSLMITSQALAVQGSVRIIKTSGATSALAWTNQTATIILEVTDNDLNVPLKRVLYPGDSTDLPGTQSSTAGSTAVTSTADISSALAVGDTVLFTGEERVKKVATVATGGSSFTTSTPFTLGQSNNEAREVIVAGGKFATCPDCTNSPTVSITVDVSEQVFPLPNFPQLDTNVGAALANRFSGVPDTAFNKLDARVVDSAGADYGGTSLTVTSLDAPNGTLRIICNPACTAGTAYVLYWTSTSDNEGVAEDPASASRIQVTSQADVGGIGVVVSETGASTGVFERSVTLCGMSGCSDETSSPPKLQVGLSDTVTMAYKDVNGTNVSASVTVETDSPTFANLSPANNTAITSPLPIITGDVTDTGSGVKKSTLSVVFNVNSTISTLDPNDSATGISTISGGYGVSQQRPSTPSVTNADVLWWIKADDDAGNSGVSDRVAPSTITGTVTTMAASTTVTGVETNLAGDLVVGQTITVGSETRRVIAIASDTSLTVDAAFTTSQLGQVGSKSTCVASSYAAIATPTSTDNGGCDPYTVKIDNSKPDLNAATTGYFWDTTMTTTDKTNILAVKAHKNSVAADFNEDVDGTTVSASDFAVTVGGTAVSIIQAEHFSGKASRVFLTLGTDLAADAKPLVKLVGQVKDKAGNDLTIDEVTAADHIAPTITVTVTGTGGSVPITKDKVTIQFTTDEGASVTSNSVQVRAQGTATLVTGADLSTVAPTLVTANTWKVEVTPPADGVFNVFVTATDLSANAGTKGDRGTAGDPISTASTTTSILFEKDTAVAAPEFSPAVSTDDPDSFIVIDYLAEGKEYGLDSAGNFTTTAANVVTDGDTHGKVTLTSVTLDGVDILANVVTEDNLQFLYKSQGLALGDHTVKVKASDDAGNTNATEVSHKFKVTAVGDIEVQLRPGWNLVSIPTDPADPAINSVIAETHPVDTVLAYDATNGVWLTATRDSTSGLLVGDLTTLTSIWALWVHTDSFQSLKVTPAPQETFGAVPPTLNLLAGWNLVPVIKLDLSAGDSSAAVYLAGTLYTRAYKFDTLTNKFVALAHTDTMDATRGYWVYVPKEVALVPAA